MDLTEEFTLAVLIFTGIIMVAPWIVRATSELVKEFDRS